MNKNLIKLNKKFVKILVSLMGEPDSQDTSGLHERLEHPSPRGLLALTLCVAVVLVVFFFIGTPLALAGMGADAYGQAFGAIISASIAFSGAVIVVVLSRQALMIAKEQKELARETNAISEQMRNFQDPAYLAVLSAGGRLQSLEHQIDDIITAVDVANHDRVELSSHDTNAALGQAALNELTQRILADMQKNFSSAELYDLLRLLLVRFSSDSYSRVYHSSELSFIRYSLNLLLHELDSARADKELSRQNSLAAGALATLVAQFCNEVLSVARKFERPEISSRDPLKARAYRFCEILKDMPSFNDSNAIMIRKKDSSVLSPAIRLNPKYLQKLSNEVVNYLRGGEVSERELRKNEDDSVGWSPIYSIVVPIGHRLLLKFCRQVFDELGGEPGNIFDCPKNTLDMPNDELKLVRVIQPSEEFYSKLLELKKVILIFDECLSWMNRELADIQIEKRWAVNENKSSVIFYGSHEHWLDYGSAVTDESMVISNIHSLAKAHRNAYTHRF